MKKLRWMGDSLEVIQGWSLEAKKQAGDNLHYVQRGFNPTNWKALKGFREAVKEIRFRVGKSHYRVIFIASFNEAVYVLHAFLKKSRGTPKQEISMIQSRLKDVRALRERKR